MSESIHDGEGAPAARPTAPTAAPTAVPVPDRAPDKARDGAGRHPPATSGPELERLAAVGRLARPMAHGLNNALMVASGNLEFVRARLVAAGLPTEEVDEIEEALVRATGFVRQLREASRVEAGAATGVSPDAG